MRLSMRAGALALVLFCAARADAAPITINFEGTLGHYNPDAALWCLANGGYNQPGCQFFADMATLGLGFDPTGSTFFDFSLALTLEGSLPSTTTIQPVGVSFAAAGLSFQGKPVPFSVVFAQDYFGIFGRPDPTIAPILGRYSPWWLQFAFDRNLPTEPTVDAFFRRMMLAPQPQSSLFCLSVTGGDCDFGGGMHVASVTAARVPDTNALVLVLPGVLLGGWAVSRRRVAA